MMKETIAQEAKRLLEGIPESKWITESFSDGECKCCAIGHYERLTSEDPSDYSLFNCSDAHRGELRVSSEEFLCETKHGGDITDINNFGSLKYIQKTPKRRVMALIRDMVKAGY